MKPVVRPLRTVGSVEGVFSSGPPPAWRQAGSHQLASTGSQRGGGRGEGPALPPIQPAPPLLEVEFRNGKAVRNTGQQGGVYGHS
jgi:hypothetical protein